MRGQGDSRDLSLVAHLGQEEREQGGAEYAEVLGDLRLLFLDLVADQSPDGHSDEGKTQDPPEYP